MILDVAHAYRPCPGHTVSGDATVARTEGASTLFGVIDALGHGLGAAEVADKAVAFLQTVDLERPFGEIVEALHDALSHTRGAASALCRVRNGMLELSIVGNVVIRSVGTRVGVIASPGILGRRVRKFRYSRSRMRPGDRLVVYSDGLSRVDLEPVRRLPATEACDDLLRNHARPSDDASVVVADFLS